MGQSTEGDRLSLIREVQCLLEGLKQLRDHLGDVGPVLQVPDGLESKSMLELEALRLRALTARETFWRWLPNDGSSRVPGEDISNRSG